MDKFVIELNKKFIVKHEKTCCDSIKVENFENLKLFQVDFFLNWDSDKCKFTIKSREDIHVDNCSIFYERIGRFSLENEQFILPSNLAKESNNAEKTIFHATGSYFQILIDYFSPHKKSFVIVFSYVYKSKNFESTYSVPLPEIKQTAWEERKVSLGQSYPCQLGGKDFCNSYKRNFKSRGSSSSERDLCHDFEEYENASMVEKFQHYDFLRIFQLSVAIEDQFNMDEIDKFALENQVIFKVNEWTHQINSKLYQFNLCKEKVKKLHNSKKFYYMKTERKNLPTDVIGLESIRIVSMLDYQQIKGDTEEMENSSIFGRVEFILGDDVVFSVVNKNNNNQSNLKIEQNRLYYVGFVPNRIVDRTLQRCLQSAVDDEMLDFLFDFNDGKVKGRHKKKNISESDWMNESLKSNDEQQVAVKNIVNRTAFPSPYIVFGPPGTGKTTTIIEAIAQIVKLKPFSHILVTAGSNASCDDIVMRLKNYVSLNKIFRMYSPVLSTSPHKVTMELKEISNLRNNNVCTCDDKYCRNLESVSCEPSYEEFYTAKIIVSTMISVGRLVTAGIKSNHFDYIFIDESASQHEPNVYVPIVGLGMSENGIHSQIVLSGDHHQLGPIIKHKKAAELGLGISIMERLVNTLKYYTEKDPKFIMQLALNYRSHPAIIRFSNEHFYEGKIKYCCQNGIQEFAIGWEYLKNAVFPIIFHNNTSGMERKIGKSKENEIEAQIVQRYLEEILLKGINGKRVRPEEIGIITPYNGQKILLRTKLKNHQDVEVGSVENYQGKEKKIIILSTVRSNTKHIGFMNNYKRLNVAITRAKSLLIIVGNSRVLQKSDIWNKFIEYCYLNGAMAGDSRA